MSYLQLNRTELGCLLGRIGHEFSEKDIDVFGQNAFDMGIRAVFITLGKDGVLVLTPDRARILACSHFGNIEDTTGCGDVFCAVTVKELLDGVDPFSAAQAGVDLATRATKAKGVEETFELVRRSIGKIAYP